MIEQIPKNYLHVIYKTPAAPEGAAGVISAICFRPIGASSVLSVLDGSLCRPYVRQGNIPLLR